MRVREDYAAGNVRRSVLVDLIGQSGRSAWRRTGENEGWLGRRACPDGLRSTGMRYDQGLRQFRSSAGESRTGARRVAAMAAARSVGTVAGRSRLDIARDRRRCSPWARPLRAVPVRCCGTLDGRALGRVWACMREYGLRRCGTKSEREQSDGQKERRQVTHWGDGVQDAHFTQGRPTTECACDGTTRLVRIGADWPTPVGWCIMGASRDQSGS